MSIKSRIRTVPDHPKPGIQFRDITTLMQDPVGMRLTVEMLVKSCDGVRIDKVAGIEARGFIFGGALAHQIQAGFVPVRKPGKLPWKTLGQDYALEYGTDRIEIHSDAILEGENVLLIDDLIATGGTALASIDIIERVGGKIVGCTFVVDLPDLGGSRRIAERGYRLTTLCSFEGE
ncbi:MAG: adenine phosphoribosyltransferase [Myxococcales bacterium]|nr:adenine phosphoribosyltransferase [Myxococcales bacterium]MDH5307590.1 adenine phosphoribosyltransferase [Myxococcales bacterium]MDH5568100.1 adenine phosphoribosyltransferase [Myxococcales bacterium]